MLSVLLRFFLCGGNCVYDGDWCGQYSNCYVFEELHLCCGVRSQGMCVGVILM